MKHVAAALGVSTATVSRSLRGDPTISLATRRAVQEMADRVQYRPLAAARRLRTKSSSLIGVVVQSLGDGYVGDVVLGIQRRARDLGYQPLFFASEGREDLEAEALEVFLSEQVSEFIAVSPTARPRLLRQAVDEGLHVAVINLDTEIEQDLFEAVGTAPVVPEVTSLGSGDIEGICNIAFDDVAAGVLATRYLADLGHTSFVHLSGPHVQSSLYRLLGYRRALEALGRWPQPVLSTAGSAEPLIQETREAAVSEYLRNCSPPLAMVAYDDLSAIAALRAAHGLGWRVPDDLSVVGIDDIPFAAYTNPALTTVAQPTHELGAIAVEVLLGVAETRPRGRVLDGRLVVRESTTAPATLRSARMRPGQNRMEAPMSAD
jgi:DNA-binding LacI/PurR family transcriptional regulator